MKAYVIGDIQAHAYEQYSTTDAFDINSRIRDITKELTRIRKLAIKHHVKYILVLGDVFESRGKLDISVLNLIHREFKKYLQAGLIVVFILGNHDKHPVGDLHSLEVFKEIATVVDTPKLLKLDNTRVLAIPYLAEEQETLDALKEHGKQAKIILMHSGIKKVKMASGGVWKEGVRLGDLPKHAYVFVGHDHVFKQLRSRVWVVGSLLQINWSDHNIPKYFGMYHDGKVTFHHTRGPEFIALEANTFDQVKTHAKIMPIAKNFIRVAWTGSIDQVGKIKKYLLAQHARAVEVDTSSTVIEQKTLNTPKKIYTLLAKSASDIPVDERSAFLDLGHEMLAEAFAKEGHR